MNILLCIILGFIIASTGSISPSFLNLTVVKFSLKSGKKAALFFKNSEEFGQKAIVGQPTSITGIKCGNSKVIKD